MRGSADKEWNFAVKTKRRNGDYNNEGAIYTTDLLEIADDDILLSNNAYCCSGRYEQPVSLKRKRDVDADYIKPTFAAGGQNAVDVTVHEGAGIYRSVANGDDFATALAANMDLSYILYEMDGFFFGHDFVASWAVTCGNDIVQLDYPVSMPEPTTLAIFGIGLIGLGVRRRIRQAT